ncbi:MAG: PspA/IM30 family protein [Armatimonadetes bacterium]|nr:PspA/IM30 family protein [Armatimonadota bacterium]
MGIFKRLSDIIKANINDLLNRAEDPEKMLNQMLVEMREQLAQAKRQVAVAIADEKKLRRELDKTLEEVQKWEQRAMQALQQGNEELAKKALAQRNQCQELATQYQTQWEQQAAAVEALKGALRQLNQKIEEAKRRKDLLIARKKRAEAQRQIQETLSGIGETSAFETFERMEKQILEAEAQAEAAVDINAELSGMDLESQFSQLERSPALDADLEELKARMGMTATEDASVDRTVELGPPKADG